MSSGYDMGIDTSRRNVKPRPLTDNERARLEEFLESIHYSSRSVAPSRYCHRLLPALPTDNILRIVTRTANSNTDTCSCPKPC